MSSENPLFPAKCFTLDDGVDERAKSVVHRLHVSENGSHGLAIRVLQTVPRRIDEQLLRQATGELVGVFEHELFEPIDVGKLCPPGNSSAASTFGPLPTPVDR